MADEIEPWSQLYAQVPRPGPRPLWFELAGASVATVVLLSVGFVTAAYAPARNWLPGWQLQHSITILTGGLAAFIAAIVIAAISHASHTWIWGDTELARLIWGDSFEVDDVATAMVFLPIAVTAPGLNHLIRHFMGRRTLVAERLIEGKIERVRFRTSIFPESGSVGYGWIIQSRVPPRIWRHMASVIPGGGTQIIVPDDAMVELDRQMRKIRGLRPSVPAPARQLAEPPAVKLPAKKQQRPR